MVIAVICTSVTPTLFEVGHAAASPLLFTGARQFVAHVVAVAMLAAFVLYLRSAGKLLPTPRHRLRHRAAGAITPPSKGTGRASTWPPGLIGEVRENWTRQKSLLLLGSTVGKGGFVLFAVGLVFIDISIAAVLHTTWPLFLVLGMSFLFRHTKRYRPVTWAMLFFLVPAMTGIVLVVASHSERETASSSHQTPATQAYHPPAANTAAVAIAHAPGGKNKRAIPGPTADIPRPPWHGTTHWFAGFGTLIGALIVLASAAFAAEAACTLKLGTLLARDHRFTENLHTSELVFATACNAVAQGTAGVILCIAGLLLSETLTPHQMFYSLLGGIYYHDHGCHSQGGKSRHKQPRHQRNSLCRATCLPCLVVGAFTGRRVASRLSCRWRDGGCRLEPACQHGHKTPPACAGRPCCGALDGCRVRLAFLGALRLISGAFVPNSTR